MRKLRVFAASPADMATERAKVETIASQLKPLADNLDIVLDVVDWRAVVPDMGRPQQVILDQLEPTAWEVFIGILWHRFGTPPGCEDPQTQKEYLAGTEEEFKAAYRLWKKFGKPRIMMYCCTRAIPHDALDPDQFKRVREFFAQFDALKGEHPGLYQSFNTTNAFETLLHANLQKLLIEYGEHIKGTPVADKVVKAVAPKIPDNLPRREPFFGRSKEMGIALRALNPEDRTWGVLVDGIGGIGKTALAVEAAYCCKNQGSFDAFIFVNAKQNILTPTGIRESTPAARTLDEFFDETARVLGQTGILQLAGDDKRRALLDALRSERALLIYDNLETLTEEAQEALADFLRELPPGCKAIITSRRRGGEGSVWLRLDKLGWEAARKIIQSEMTLDSQLADKLWHVGEARWHELYDETRGSPLALKDTLGKMRVSASLTFDGALERWRGNRTPDLKKFFYDSARQDLTVNDQAALGALSLFVPSATFEAWMDVAEMSHNALETTIDRLSALSLVDILAAEERYAMNPLTRKFVHEYPLADAQMARKMSIRFAEYWVAYAGRYGGEGISNHETYNRLESEWANLKAAAAWVRQTAVQGDKVGDKNAAEMLDDLEKVLYLFRRYVGCQDEKLRSSARQYEAGFGLRRGSLIVVSGPSGAGKSTLIRQALAAVPELAYSVSATTRLPRKREIDGWDYLFLSLEQFERWIEEDRFLEWAELSGNFYGTPEDQIDELLNSGYSVILEIDLQGAREVRRKRPDAVMVFVKAPSLEEAHRRLEGRATETAEVLENRFRTYLAAARNEFEYEIVNGEPEQAREDIVRTMKEIIRGGALSTKNPPKRS